MNRVGIALRTIALAIGSAACILFAHTGLAQAMPRVAVLWQVGAPLEPWFRESVRDLGYVDGKNVTIDWRIPDTDVGKIRALCAELARSRVDLIVAGGTLITKEVLAATQAIPVVFIAGDPVGTGFVSSLAYPGGNATGISSGPTDLSAKRLQLLHATAPHAQRMIYLRNPLNPAQDLGLTAVLAAARALGITVDTLDVSQLSELDAALSRLASKHAGAVLVSGEVPFFTQRTKIATAIRKAGLPAMFPFAEYHDAGVLMSYGPSARDMIRRVAVYVDRILKGAKASELPVEQISTFDFVINLRVAREMGIKIPQEVLYRADRVIR